MWSLVSGFFHGLVYFLKNLSDCAARVKNQALAEVPSWKQEKFQRNFSEPHLGSVDSKRESQQLWQKKLIKGSDWSSLGHIFTPWPTVVARE